MATGVAWLLGWVLGFLVLSAAFFYALLLRSLLPRPVRMAFEAVAPNADAVLVPLMIGGLFFAAALGLAVRWIFSRDSSVGLLARVGARPANLADPEEKQLANVVEEMAIAATTPPPRLYLFDGDAINAAVLGRGPGEATLLVSRRMLNTLDRDETQGVIAHLVASSVNGDLRITAAMLRMFHVLGLAVTILDLPFSGRARTAMLELIRFILHRRSFEKNSAGADSVAARLTASLQPEGLDGLITFMQRLLEPKSGGGVRKVVGALVLMPLLPLIMIRLAAAILYGMLSLFVLGPLVALALRSRRRLADATAVQLTRNPDGLACALVHLVQLAQPVASAGWSEMLFIIGAEAASGPAAAADGSNPRTGRRVGNTRSSGARRGARRRRTRDGN